MIKNKNGNKVIKNNEMDCNGDSPFITVPVIDKISLLIDMPDADIHGCFYSGLLEKCEEKDPQFARGSGNAKYPLAVKVTCPDIEGVFEKDGPVLLMQVTSKKNGNPQVRLEYNPAKIFGHLNELKPDAAEAPVKFLDDLFEEICGVSFFQFLFHARVSGIDVCRDVLWRDLENYLFRMSYAVDAQNRFGKTGRIQTMYFGKRGGNQTRVYNKAKEMHGNLCPYDVIRIERHVRLKGFKTSELWGMENPFRRVGVYSLKPAKLPFDSAHWAGFADSCRYRGVSNAIKMQPQKMRARLRKFVREAPVGWWQINDEDWCHRWHEALADVCFDRIPAHAPKLTTKNLCGGG